MRRKSTGSVAEDDADDSSLIPNAAPTSLDSAGPRSRLNDSSARADRWNPQSSSRQTTSQNSPHELDRRKSSDTRPSATRSRRPSKTNWKAADLRDGQGDKDKLVQPITISLPSKDAIEADRMAEARLSPRRPRTRSPWSCSPLTLLTTALAALCLFTIMHSFTTRQLDTKGCRMSYMRPSFAKLSDFDTEHTRFASKYSVYLYREGMVDEDTKVGYMTTLTQQR